MALFSLNNPDLYIVLALSIINTIFMCLVAHKFLHIMQLSNYKIRKYFVWIKDTKAKWISKIVFLSLLLFLGMFVCNALFRGYTAIKFLSYLGMIFYFWFMLVYILNSKKVPEKKKLVHTNRIIRIYILLSIIMFNISFWLLAVSYEYTIFKFCVIAITPLSLTILVPFCVFLLKPLEKLINSGYIRSAKKKLKKAEPIIKIGITGSYGKTSTKVFLSEMLKKKYKVVATPESYNTPMGITKCINKGLKRDTQIFVCEMGADHVGDIKEICNIVKPNIAVITAVGEQHLETFGSFENVVKTKCEIIDSLDENGKVFFNGECEKLKDVYETCNHKNKVLTGFKIGDVTCDTIKMTKTGLSFNIVIDDKKYLCRTKVLGLHNLQNIMLAVNVALYLKVDIKDIVDSIYKLNPVYHRLELMQSENGITIIDDSFNSNVEGTIHALNVLSSFKTSRKVVVTPGLVELGKKEFEENVAFGERIAEKANICIIVNTINKEAIKKGLLNKKFDENNIYEVESLFLATELFKTVLKKGDVVLLENDLPDNYR